ncbi:hypothetical protein AYK24_00655 [Thermoplasmatales archaeon SG8-52-4]|nr:MAG: hypothetical protein AYK24_00655 [Thermoplasmatales archaeon SG8-52-4]
MAVYPYAYNDNRLYGTVTNSKGIPIASMGVVLWKVQENGDLIAQVDYDTTERTGLWQFGITETGWYTVKFYGGGAIPSNNINRVYLEYSPTGTDYQELTYTIQPTFNIIELTSKVDVNKAEKAIIQIAFSNLTPDTGDLRSIEVYSRRTEDAVDYSPFKTIPIAEDEISALNVRAEIILEAKPDYFDFMAIFFDGLGIPYKSGGTVYQTYDTNVKLDGVPDVYEYVEGVDLEATNTPDPESGTITGNIIKLKWTDLKNLARTAFPIESKDAFGRAVTISYEMAQRLIEYIVFMYVSDTETQPIKPYPGIAALYGAVPFGTTQWAFKDLQTQTAGKKWVYMGDFATSSAEFTLPRNVWVAFWVGFKTYRTNSQIETERYVY